MEKNQQENSLIEKTVEFVKCTLKEAESGHDWYHIERVWKNSIKIAEEEIKNNPHLKINFIILELAALLHDIADHKFHQGDELKGSKVAREFLIKYNVQNELIDRICEIIYLISFKGAKEENQMTSLEGKIVQDADRLDAIGAIGIGRAFSFGGFKNRLMHNPEEKPKLNMNWEEYKNNKGTTINHFYEKLFLIKDRMNTDTGKKLALKRHQIMVNFVEEFLKEWNLD